jgi:inosine-uridine nucleoside N-ribohydrolase
MKGAMTNSKVQLLVLCSSLIFLCQAHRQLGAEEGPDAKGIPIVLSTDIGNEIDDQWAVAYLFTNPAFKVLGVISAQAPSLPDPSAHGTYLILRDEVEHRLGLSAHPPLYEGASLPLKDTATPRRNAGTEFLIEASKGFSSDRRLNVLAIGAATDVASAILQDPTIVNRIRIVTMAFGSTSIDGGKEYNVQNDPKAWQVLLNSDVPLVVGPGDVCRKYLALNYEQAQRLLAGHGPVGAWLWGEYQSWYYRSVKPLRSNDFSKSWFIWDIITLANLQGFTTERTAIRPQLSDDLSLNMPSEVNGGRQITWITAVDSTRLWSDFIAHLDEFQRLHAVADCDLSSKENPDTPTLQP